VIDPVTLDIIENALRNARIEMDATLVRTAMSPGIREQGDAFPLIADHTGKMIVGQFGSFIGRLPRWLRRHVEDGDMIFLSDPYSVRRRDQPLATTGWCCCRCSRTGA
jgi:N-methylhydantoinase B